MKQTRSIVRRALVSLPGLAWLGASAFAHSPICSCYDNGDGTITCEGGFSDGSSAQGVKMRVTDDRDRLLVEGEMGEDSTFSFEKPEGEYFVVFDPGQEHRMTIYGADIL